MEQSPWDMAPLQWPLLVRAARTAGWPVWAPQGSCGPLSLRDALLSCRKLQKDRTPRAWSLRLPVTLVCPRTPLPPRGGG